MENRASLKFLFLFFVLLLLPLFSFAYDDKTTHPALTDEIVDFYNLVFDASAGSPPSQRITQEQKELIVKGSIDEDAFPRYFNHFYDPVYQRGWKGYTSSKIWGKSSLAQSIATRNLAGVFMYTDDPGDFSWERALKDYAKGDEARAFLALGHVLHLIEDSSVPEHTRDDTHIGHGQFGSPYENWAGKFTRRNIDLAQKVYQKGKNPITKNSLGEYFNEIARYSNNHFFSEDTILNKRYRFPKVLEYKDIKTGEGFITLAYGVDEDDSFMPLFIVNGEISSRNLFKNSILTLRDETYILTDYWNRLSQKTILVGAGVIDLFLNEAKIAREIYEKEMAKKKGPLEWIAGLFLRKPIGDIDPPSLAKAVERAKSEFTSFSTIVRKDVKREEIDEDGEYEKGLTNDNDDDDNDDDDKNNAKQGEDDRADEEYERSISNDPSFASAFAKASAGKKASEGKPPFAKASEGKQNSKQIEEVKRNDEALKSDIPKIDKETSPRSPVTASSGSSSNNLCSIDAQSQATPLQSLLINEVAWSGTPTSAFNEWIELKNTQSQEASLSGWQLQDKTRDIQVTFSTNAKIASAGYVLLERTDDTSVPGRTADFIYTGALNDTNDALYLFDNQCRLVDKVGASPNWPAGTSSPDKKSMERKSDLSWQTYQGSLVNEIWGTPKNANSTPPLLQDQKQEEKQSPPSYKKGDVIFSEIAWMGTAPSNDTHEWIELKNNISSEVLLNGWKIEKGDGSLLVGDTGDTFGKNHKILTGGYFLLERNEAATSIVADKMYDGTLNNSGETLILKDANGNEIDKVEMASGWQAGKNETHKDGYKPTMSNFGSLTSAVWKDGKPTPKGVNEALPLEPPQAPTLSLTDYKITKLSFSVTWGLATTTPNFSSYEVEKKIGSGGTWEAFYSGTQTSQSFTATKEAVYYFRARIKDTNNLASSWTEVSAEVNQHPLVINEIMYNPDPGDDAFYEYVELFNRSSSSIDLSNWKLTVDSDEDPLLLDKTASGNEKVSTPGGFALVGDKPASISDPHIYDGVNYAIPSHSSSTLRLTIDDAALSLLNTSSKIILKDDTGFVVDEVTYTYLQGANGNGKALERVNPAQGGNTQANWGESSVGGTPNAQNASYNPSATPGTYIPNSSGSFTITQDTLWTKAQSPYLLESNSGTWTKVGSGATLYLEPGVVIKPQSCCGNTAIEIQGTLKAQGTLSEPILITSKNASPQRGDWKNIVFKNTSSNSSLTYVTIEYGGADTLQNEMVKVENTSVTFDNVTIRQALGVGLSLTGGSSQVTNSTFDRSYVGIKISDGSPTVQNSTIKNSADMGNNAHYGVVITGGSPTIQSNTFSANLAPVHFLASAKPSFSQNTASGHTSYNGIYVSVAAITSDTTWKKDLPYAIESNSGSFIQVNASTTLTLEPGVILKPFNQFDNLVIFGSLNAQGTASQPIVITSVKDDSKGGDTNADGAISAPSAGDWKRILFKTNSSSTLSFVTVSYGGNGNVGALTKEAGAVVNLPSVSYNSNVQDLQEL